MYLFEIKVCGDGRPPQLESQLASATFSPFFFPSKTGSMYLHFVSVIFYIFTRNKYVRPFLRGKKKKQHQNNDEVPGKN